MTNYNEGVHDGLFLWWHLTWFVDGLFEGSIDEDNDPSNVGFIDEWEMVIVFMLGHYMGVVSKNKNSCAIWWFIGFYSIWMLENREIWKCLGT